MMNSFKPQGDKAHYSAEWVSYELMDGDDEVLWVNVSVKVSHNGWVAIGFNMPDVDTGFDVIVANEKGVMDRYQKDGYQQFFTEDDTAIGGFYNLNHTSSQYSNGELQVKFSRKLNTNDTYDYNLEREGKVQILWAYGNMSGDALGSAVEKGVTTLDSFVVAEMEKNEEQQLKAHGIMMALVVMVLMTSGIVLSRYLKLIFPSWFYVHAAIFCLSLFFVIVSVIIIFQAHGNKFVPGWHSVFGLLFLIGMGIQTLLGLVSHLRFDAKRSAPPFFPDKIHWYLGRGMFFLGVATVLLGLYVLPARKIAKNAFYAWIVIIFFFVLALEKGIGQTHETTVKGIAEDDEAFMDSDDEQSPKRRNSLSHGVVARPISAKFLFKLFCPAASAIFISFVVVAVGINTTHM